MCRLSLLVISCIVCTALIAQQPSSQWKTGHITTVKPSATTEDKADSSQRQHYDVSIRVGDTIYTVLFTDERGVGTIRYRAGMSLLVRVAEETLTYNDRLGHPVTVPILRSDTVQVRH